MLDLWNGHTHAPKLMPVHVMLRRGVGAVAFLATCVLVLQVGDVTSAAPAPVVLDAVLERQSALGMPPRSDRAYLLTHTRVIPLGRSSINVPILMYHYIRPAPSIYADYLGYRLTVTPADFTAQMDWLAAGGYNPVDFNDLRAYFSGAMPLPAKPVVLTFDDGYADLYATAYPVLKSHKFKAVAYIVTSFVGQARYVTAAQVVEMDHHGVQIASHTVDHANVARASRYSATNQLANSRTWLESLTGHSVVDFAYPSGQFSSMAIAVLQATGYDTAVTELPGTVHSRSDRYLWTRERIYGGESLADFVNNLGPVEPWVDVAAMTTTPERP
jgi:peptidoglycan/xylan/chitin deacetylase (PgdA/CDA1 family)